MIAGKRGVFITSAWGDNRAKFVRLFLRGDLSQFPVHIRLLVYPVRVVIRAFEEFFVDKCILRASALAFASLLALVPVTAIFFSFLTRLESFSEIQLKVEDLLFRNLIPARTEVIRAYLTQYTQNVTLLGVFGITTLLITAIFLFNTIEHTINDIWHAKQKRPFLNKFTSVWTVLTATPVLIFISFYIASKLSSNQVDLFSLRFLTYVLNWLAFWFAYQYIPYTYVRIRASVVGAVVGGTLWELAKGGFNWYITNMTSFDKIYGSLGAIPVFLLWLYLTWVIVLFGAEVAYAVQYPQGEKRLTHAELESCLEFYSVRAMAEIVKRFADGRTDAEENTIDRLKEVGIPPEVSGKILNRLAERRLILYTEDKNYVPAREPSRITIREVIEAVSDYRMRTPETGDDPISTRLKETFLDAAACTDSALDGLSIGSLVQGTGK